MRLLYSENKKVIMINALIFFYFFLFTNKLYSKNLYVFSVFESAKESRELVGVNLNAIMLY